MFSERPEDRRGAPRFPHSGRAHLLICPGSRRTVPIEAAVVDYSETGLGLISDVSLAIGQKYVVRDPTLPVQDTLIYMVARCESRPDGTFRIGLHHTRFDAVPDVYQNRSTLRGRRQVKLVLLATLAGLAWAFLYMYSS